MTLERRLDGVVKDLAPNQRALLVFHAAARGEDAERLVRLTPAEQREAMASVLARLEAMTDTAAAGIFLVQVGVLEVEQNLHALQWLLPLIERIRELTAGVRQLGGRLSERKSGRVGGKTVRLAPLPAALPWTYGEGLTLLFGPQLERDHWDDHPPSLDELLEALRHAVTVSLDVRRQQVLAWEEALRHIAARDFDGDDIVHPLLRTALDELGAKLSALTEGAEATGIDVPAGPLRDDWRDAILRELDGAGAP